MSALPHDGVSRSRLDQAPDAYHLALEIAEELDRHGLDLWAAGVRSCLDAKGSTARQQHLAVELTRLAAMGRVRQEGLAAPMRDALSRLEAGLGDLDVPCQPLYSSVRDLADHLEVGGGRRWLARLRAVLADEERTAATRLTRIDAVLRRMRDEAVSAAPTAGPVPEGTTARIDAVLVRLPRHRDAEDVARYVGFALQPPQPSRVLAADDRR